MESKQLFIFPFHMTPDHPRSDVNIKCKQDHRQYKNPKNSMLKEIKTTVECTHNNNQIPILMFTLIQISEL